MDTNAAVGQMLLSHNVNWHDEKQSNFKWTDVENADVIVSNLHSSATKTQRDSV